MDLMLIVFVFVSIVQMGVFVFKQKTAYEMRISDWSSDVCSSDLGANDNYAKLPYARKRREGNEYTVDRRLGFISLNMPLNNDQVLAVAFRYTAGGREYQVGEFSTDVPVTPSQPQMLVAKLLKNEILKTNLPIWDLMMKNIYSIGAYGVGQNNFRFNIFRIEDESGVEKIGRGSCREQVCQSCKNSGVAVSLK